MQGKESGAAKSQNPSSDYLLILKRVELSFHIQITLTFEAVTQNPIVHILTQEFLSLSNNKSDFSRP